MIMSLPMGLWRPYLGLLLELGRDATDAEVYEYIRTQNARHKPDDFKDITYNDITHCPEAKFWLGGK